MKLKWNRRYTTIAVYAALVLFVALFIVFFFINNNDFGKYISDFFTVMSPIIYGVVIAYLLNPVVSFFDRKVFAFIAGHHTHNRMRRSASIAATTILFLTFIGLLAWAVVPALVSSITDFQANFTTYVSNIENWLNEKSETSGLIAAARDPLLKALDSVVEFIETLMDRIIPQIRSIASTVFEILKNILVGVVLSIMLLFAKERVGAKVKKLCRAVLSENRNERLMSAVSKADKSFGGYIKGTIVDSIIVGIEFFILMMIFNVPYYPLIAIVLTLTNMIPIFGPYIGSIPSGVLILFADPSKVIPFAIMVVVVQAIDGNLVAPRLIGSNIGLKSEWVIIAITIMSGFFGIIGMFIGVPLFAVLYTFISDKLSERLKKRGLPSDTDSYCSGSAETPANDEKKENTENGN